MSPDTLCCSHCRSKGMTVVRLASKHQLKCWLKILGSKPTCKAPENVEVCYRKIAQSLMYCMYCCEDGHQCA